MKVSTHLFAQLSLFAALGSAYLQDPPTTADPNTVSDCSWWIVAASTDTCEAIADANGISVSDFELVYNPSVGTVCALNVGQSYCVERNFGIPPVTTTTTTSAPTSTTTGNGITTPTPSQPGMVSNCNKFDFVNPDDSCSAIAARNGITVVQLSEWNSAGEDCTSLWGKVYVCVGVIGASTTSTITTTSTTTGNGITTPTPTQPGMVSNCNKFDFVNKGDSCSAIASRNGITIANLIEWNNAGTDCTSLWGEVYVCVGVVGTSTTLSTSTTTTTTGNGVSTPTPTQPGMVSNCHKFDFVNKGDTCAAIASRNGISVEDLVLWNSGGTDCTSIWALVYVCVGVLSSVFANTSQAK
ncbi:carbohydrate-binding module family 50 protein [Hypoxylon sp. CO27-5]|nr:carbohydrate-binding module family 50 protein [Hypoxylon sp. CO27-5]